ncbi:MAG: glycerophosphodiester phosphodiesterase [Verrucomicrobia bacterium]|nr:glycerophosphodiester phosphodiesterase [Verrucomicrobiota bacterium]
MNPTALLLLLATLATAAHTRAVDIIAHRGASHDAPENTLASFKLGWQQHADACELDIWLSKDGKLIVSHDADTKRITGIAKKIPESTLAELRSLDAGSWKDPKWMGEKLPTLDEVLALIPDGKRLVIEIKCGVEVLPELERVLKASGKPASQLVIISFHYDVCAQSKKLFPKIPVLFLSSFKQDKATGAWTPTPASLIGKAKAAGLEGINLAFKGPLDAAFVKQTHAAGLKFYVWTVDDAAVAKKLLAAGVDGLTTNRPEWLREQLR